MKALVTGSCGFIGSHLVEALIEKGYEVHCLVRKESNRRWLDRQKVVFREARYSDQRSLGCAVEGMDLIFHLGAVIDAPDWETYFGVNTLGTKNLIEACAEANPGLKRFVYVSSIAASGPSERGLLKTEDDEPRPASLYGKSKLLAENFVLRYRPVLPVVIVRLPNVLGIREDKILSVLKLVKKRILPMLGNGEKQTSLCFVEDAVQAMILAAEKERACGETYFVTDDRAYSWRELIYFIAQALGVGPLALKLPYWAMLGLAGVMEAAAKLTHQPPLVARYDIKASRKHYGLYDGRKIKVDLGFQARIDFENGMRSIILWYKEQGLI
jgi:nucleoside-diphosphate-sugar epimerase